MADRTRRSGRSYAGWLWRNGARKCHYCDVMLVRWGNGQNRITADHRRALSNGGYDKRKNVVACCNQCNQAKGRMDAEAFRQAIRNASEQVLQESVASPLTHGTLSL